MAGNGKKFLAGAALGVIAGAIAGLLFAPKSGAETRKIIKEKAKEIGKEGQKLAVSGKEAVEKGIEKVTEQFKK